jgi:predicted Rossmann fold nucleotide-binding protein DprA/Smf involved in DNA uptake
VTKIEADGYKNVQGLARGADGKWHGKALRGSTMVDVVVDAAGKVTTQ